MSSTLTSSRAALYFGAKVQVQGCDRLRVLEVAYLCIDIPNIIGLISDITNHTFNQNISDCKLILRTVEQLTNEEECIVIGLSNLDPTAYLVSFQGGNKICFFKDENTGFCTTLDLLPVSAADYLRSIHVDIDNAIADGWAVKKEVSHE